MSTERPWEDEPDRVEFEMEGFPCLITRGPMGNLCGYVAVPPGHPWHGKDWSKIDASAHGGLTYSDACQGDICHVPKPGEPDDVWWVGFDCAHAWDVVPKVVDVLTEIRAWGDKIPERFGTYRTISYVRRQIESLVKQAKAAVQP